MILPQIVAQMEQDKFVMFAGLVIVLAVSVFILWGPSNLKRKRLKRQVGGLVNLGHSCFLNALLQAFGSCPSVTSWLTNYEHDPGGLVPALRSTLEVINGVHEEIRDDPFAPYNFMTLLKSRWNITPGEQDAHELFIVLIDALEEELRKITQPKECSLMDALEISPNTSETDVSMDCDPIEPKSKDATMRLVHSEMSQPRENAMLRLSKHKLSESLSHGINSTVSTTEVTSPFQGLLTSSLQCTNCDHKNVVQCDKFECLSLPLPSETERCHTLEQLITGFVATEIVSMTCDKCKLSDASVRKKLNFGKLPSCLCIHIVRTTWQSDGRPSKRMDHVSFPEQLVMDGHTYTQRGGDTEEKRHVYDLKAVVVHNGDVEKGHFLTYRSSKYSWVLISDADVIECSKSEALATSPYMLFYDKR